MLGRLALMTASICVSLNCPQTSFAQATGFRVETDLFQGTEKVPFHQTVTLFSDGVAYDFPRDHDVITMVDPKRNRIVLLHQSRKIRTEVDLVDLRKLIASAKTSATGALAEIIADADQVQVEADRVAVGEKILTYEATLQSPRMDGVAEEYAACADALAMLNAGRDPAALPYARLSLNAAIAQKGAVPREIIRKQVAGKTTHEVKCILHANWRLSSSDREKIADTGKMLVSFAAVTQQEFFQDRVASADQAD